VDGSDLSIRTMRMVRAEKGFGIGKRRRVERSRAVVLDWR
jgi:hypothetical protein